MARYHDLTLELANRIAEGELVPGASLPSVRSLARAERSTEGTIKRAYRELAEAGAIVLGAAPGRARERERPARRSRAAA